MRGFFIRDVYNLSVYFHFIRFLPRLVTVARLLRALGARSALKCPGIEEMLNVHHEVNGQAPGVENRK